MQETMLLKAHPTRLAFLKFYFLAVLLAGVWWAVSYPLATLLSLPAQYSIYLFVLPAISAAAIIFSEVRRLNDTYIITDYRISERVGILSVKESSVHWDRIADVKMDQTFLDRIFGIGTIHVQSTGGSERPEIVIKKVAKAIRVKGLINQKILDAKK